MKLKWVLEACFVSFVGVFGALIDIANERDEDDKTR